jgi:hypothetical protein
LRLTGDPSRRRFPGRAVPPGLEAPKFLRRADQPAQAVEIIRGRAERARLDQRVAQRRRLDRARDHRQPARVGGELAEQFVPGAAADHVDDVRVPPGQLLDLHNRAAVRQGEAVEDAADDPGRAGGHRVGHAGAGGADALRHVAGGQERRVVRVDHGHQRRQPGRVRQETVQAGLTGRVTGRCPDPERLLQEPQSGDVVQVTDPPVHPGLVGEVGAPAGVAQHRLIQFHADQ